MKFKNRVDVFYTIILFVCEAICIVSGSIMFIFGEWYLDLFMTALGVLVYLLFTTLYYTIDDEFITINVLGLKRKIKLDKIKEIKKTKSVFSSYATSVKRIGFRTSDKRKIFRFIYISPIDEENFMNIIKEKVSQSVIYTGF